ncbi:hypothetical protein PilKf_02286 [Pillotina sp. SPG140]
MLLIFCAVAAGYGFVHNQISYSISTEYYTAFKFGQFSIPPAVQNRFGAGIVGIRATWWVGLIAGTVLIPLGLIIPSQQAYMRALVRALIIMLVCAFLIGIGGAIYGLAVFSPDNLPPLVIPSGVLDPVRFSIVGTMHNCGYMGGIVGLIAGAGSIIIAKFWFHT